MKKNIGVFTTYSVNPMLVRLETVAKTLDALNFNAEIISYHSTKTKKLKFINSIAFWYFDLVSVFCSIPKIFKFQIVYIQDLRLLPLAIFAKLFRKKVIYETLDNNVHLHSYYIKNKYKLPSGLLRVVFSASEKFIARFFTDIIMVNSKALHEYFNKRTTLCYYSSPFEVIANKNEASNKNAFVFLGLFSKAKGAMDILTIVKETNTPLFLFGDIPELDVYSEIESMKSLVKVSQRISSEKLKENLQILLNEYFLIGFSLIKPLNYSYATQEANKDIDYLALGVPIIGNDRKPTIEKIIAGCGVSLNLNEINTLLNDNVLKEKISNSCKNYYFNNYSYNSYLETFKNAIEKL